MNSSSEKFIKENGNFGIARQKLVSMAKSGELLFPYRRTFSDSPNVMFQRLKNSISEYGYDPYRLSSYFPEYCSYLPPIYENKYVYLKLEDNNIDKYDALSDYFIEEIRLSGRRADQTKSPFESWQDNNVLESVFTEVLSKETIDNRTIRSAFSTVVSENKTFLLSWVKGLLNLTLGKSLKNKKFLDISAGWGDRLLVAMSEDMEYLGFDPNPNLVKPHSDMIKMFGNSNKQKVIEAPFETATLKENYYDVLLSSPPYFDLEVYENSDTSQQSIYNYPNYSKWMVKFLFTSIRKAWEALKDEGYLILHLGDNKTLKMCEATNFYIESFHDSKWMGTVGVYGGSFNNKRPVWIWMKLNSNVKSDRNLWEKSDKVDYPFNIYCKNLALPSQERLLQNTYIELSKELFEDRIEKSFDQKFQTAIKNINTIISIISPITLNKLFIYNLRFSHSKLLYWISILKNSLSYYKSNIEQLSSEELESSTIQLKTFIIENINNAYTIDQLNKLFIDNNMIYSIYQLLGTQYNETDGIHFLTFIIETLNASNQYFQRENNSQNLIYHLKQSIPANLVDYYLGDNLYTTIMLEITESPQTTLETIKNVFNFKY